MSDTEKKFLIRSSGSILGPFDQKEIKDLIERRVISTSDEVTEPCSIWWYLRDHSAFKETVLAVSAGQKSANLVTRISQKIAKISNKGKTQTKTDTLKTQEKTITDHTGAETQSGLTPVRLNPLEKQSAHEIHIEDPDSLSSKKTPKARQALLRVLPFVIVGLIAAGGVAFQFLYKKEAIDQGEQEQLKALKLFDEGHYPQALPYLEKALQKGALNPRGRLLLSALWLSKGKTKKALDLTQELKDSPVLTTGEGHLLQGLLAFADNKISASKEFFKAASLAPRQKDIAWLNLALLDWKTGDYSSSLSYLSQLMKMAYDRDIVFFLKALNLLFQGETESLRSYILRDLRLGQNHELVKEYKQELYLLLAYAQSQQAQKPSAQDFVFKLLNEDPLFYQEYKYSPFVMTTVQQMAETWSDLHPYCLQIFHSDSQNSLMNALLGFCLLKKGDLTQSLKYIERAKNIEVDNPLFLSLLAHFLMQNGEAPKAKEILELIDNSQLQSGQSLPLIIKARMFEQKKDYARALSTWAFLLEKNPFHISGLAGAERASLQLKEKSRSELYRKQLLQIYPYHIRQKSHSEEDLN